MLAKHLCVAGVHYRKCLQVGPQDFEKKIGKLAKGNGFSHHSGHFRLLNFSIVALGQKFC